ncbi:MAG: MoaD/ThiS family protein [Gammaproteobacteria bacterium]
MASILYFGSLPDALGTAFEHPHLPPSVADVDSLLHWLRQRGPRWKRALADGSVQVTVNKTRAGAGTSVTDEDEIAVIPVSVH